MNIYQIDQQIQAIIENADENGEVDGELLEALQMARDQKIENLALAWKNLQAEAKAIKEEIENLADRKKAVDRQADRAKRYLEEVLAGERFRTAKVSVSYRDAQAVELDDSFMLSAIPDWLRYKEPEPNKKVIMERLKQGEHIPGAKLVTNRSTIIK